MRIFITGSTGFVGKQLCTELHDAGHEVVAAVRKRTDSFSEQIQQFEIAGLSAEMDWVNALHGVEVVVHLAGRAHILKDTARDSIELFRKVNVDSTINLAKQAAKAEIKRFVFISSIGVNGNNNSQPFSELDEPNPQEPYAVSKYLAEQALLALAKEVDMEVVIIRPPLVYGPKAPGNLGCLLKWINKGIPLPLGAVHNQRSLLALENLVSFIILCADCQKTPEAANQVFLISDDEDVSTSELLRKIGKGFGKKPLLIPVPTGLMTLVAKLIGKGDMANRLFGSLQVDSSKARELLGWKPVITMDEQLKKTADEYLPNG